MLSAELIAELYAPSAGRKAKNRTVKSYAIIRTEDGTLDKVPLDSVKIGAFKGRAGTVRRSRKGRTYRAPNGRRRYEGDYGDNVVSYKV